ncbi:hypothetical protein EDS67_24130 [candidate division KSB1 bacterium]|nr:MAG: hypothetical protein EDS67_24130 [candidate division KSB1 bacterium]
MFFVVVFDCCPTLLQPMCQHFFGQIFKQIYAQLEGLAACMTATDAVASRDSVKFAQVNTFGRITAGFE